MPSEDRSERLSPPARSPASRSVLLVLSGPSGVGKGTVVGRLRQRFPNLWESVSYTTRAQRPGEVDGHDYTFVSRADFERFDSWCHC